MKTLIALWQLGYSVSHTRSNYIGQIDKFAVYCKQLNKLYLIPIDDTNESTVYLRVDPPKNKQKKCIRWAKDYEVDIGQ